MIYDLWERWGATEGSDGLYGTGMTPTFSTFSLRSRSPLRDAQAVPSHDLRYCLRCASLRPLSTLLLSDDDDDVYYYICERLKLEGETERWA